MFRLSKGNWRIGVHNLGYPIRTEDGPAPTALCLHRAGRGHALQRPAERPGGAGERRDHAGVRPHAADPGDPRRPGPQARGAGEEVRHPVQGGVRRHPRADGPAAGPAPRPLRLRPAPGGARRAASRERPDDVKIGSLTRRRSPGELLDFVPGRRDNLHHSTPSGRSRDAARLCNPLPNPSRARPPTPTPDDSPSCADCSRRPSPTARWTLIGCGPPWARPSPSPAGSCSPGPAGPTPWTSSGRPAGPPSSPARTNRSTSTRPGTCLSRGTTWRC